MISPALPAPWLRSVSTGIPALARDIVDSILDEIPDYRLTASPLVRAHAQRTVRETLHSFLRWLTGPRTANGSSPALALSDAFRELGRTEALAGRSHDTLQTAYRIASRIVMRRLLEWEREFPIPADRAGDFSGAVFGFIAELAEYSAQGFLDALGEGPSVDRERARLLALMLDARGFAAEAVTARAERVHWALPDTATLVQAIGLPDGYGELALARLARALFGPAALAGRVANRDLMLAPDPIDATEVVPRLQSLEPTASLVVGFQVPLDRLVSSLSWIRRLAAMRSDNRVPADAVVACESNAFALMQDAGRDVYQRLIERRLGPLLALSPAKRLKYGRLLSAWLELGGTRGDVPGVLDKHRQTLRYQMARLDQLFGAQLTDRDARLEIMLALRSVMPEWERAGRESG